MVRSQAYIYIICHLIRKLPTTLPFFPFLQKIGGMFRVVGAKTHPEPARRKKGTMINTKNTIDKKRRMTIKTE